MADDSYTLREVAELLGVSKRTLQRRMQEGAFPNRFLSPGRHGLETRIPADDVRLVLEDLRRHGREQPRAMSVRP
jgi:excisionase family DNA binding protein